MPLIHTHKSTALKSRLINRPITKTFDSYISNTGQQLLVVVAVATLLSLLLFNRQKEEEEEEVWAQNQRRHHLGTTHTSDMPKALFYFLKR